jgi:hypothetical protein
MTSHSKTNSAIKAKSKKKEVGAQIKKLAETILMQSIEDLWNKEERSNCIDFFTGEGYRICSEIAGMSPNEKVEVLNFVRNILSENSMKNKEVSAMRIIRSDIVAGKIVC